MLHNKLHNIRIFVAWRVSRWRFQTFFELPDMDQHRAEGLSGAMGGHGSRSEPSKVDFKTLRPSKLFFFQHQSLFFLGGWFSFFCSEIRASQGGFQLFIQNGRRRCHESSDLPRSKKETAISHQQYLSINVHISHQWIIPIDNLQKSRKIIRQNIQNIHQESN